MSTPFFTWMTCTFGRVGFLEEAIACWLAQNYKGPAEMLIVNSFKPQVLHGDFPGVRILNLEERPPNLGALRNLAIEHAQEGVILCADDDDIFLPHFTSTFAKYFTDDCDWIWLQKMIYQEAFRIRKIVPGSCNAVAFRKSAWKTVGGYPNRDCGEDRDFISRLVKLPGKKVDIPPQEIALLYSWGQGGVYHTSGMGDDHPGRATGHERIEQFTMQQARVGNIPTGDIQLKPALLHDYEQMAKDFLAEHVTNSKKNDFAPIKIGDQPAYVGNVESLKPLPSITILYITVPTDIEHCAKLASRFCESYVKCPPGLPHETVVVCNGAPAGYTARKCFTSIPNVQFYEHDDSGWDIGAFIAYSKVCTTDLLVCFGGQGYVKRGGWLVRLVEAWKKYGPGMYGTLASYEVSPHLNTTGFMCEPHWLAEYPHTVKERYQRYNFEHGPHSCWRGVVQRGGQALLVTWDNEYEWTRWREPLNGFRAGTQEDCLTYFKHTYIFDNMLEATMRQAMKTSSDTMTDETFMKARRDRDFRLQHIGSDNSHFSAVHRGEDLREAEFQKSHPVAK